jgi:hypothetical protein
MLQPWKVNTFIVACVLVLAFAVSGLASRLISIFVTFVTAVWAYYDAKRLQIERYDNRWPAPASTPWGVAVVVCLLWLIAFPLYVSYRARLLKGAVPLKSLKE